MAARRVNVKASHRRVRKLLRTSGSEIPRALGPLQTRMSALERQATPTMLRQLALAGVLDGAELDAALRLVDGRADRAAWRTFADKLMLGVGIGLVVTGVVFFFAANWDAVSQSMRIGLALGAHVVAVVAAAVLGLHKPAGRAAAAGAALLVGPALLTYGQAYQTGADAWELFAGWAALAVPFAFIVRGTLLWAVVLGLMRASAFFYVAQLSDGREAMLWVALGCLAVDAAAVWVAQQKAPRSMAPLVFLVVGLVTLAPFLGGTLAGEMRHGEGAQVLLLLAALVVHVAGLVRAVARGRTPEAALLGLSAAFHVGLLAARVLFEELNLDEGGMFLFGLFVLAEATGLAALLGAAWRRGEARTARVEVGS